jgi:hypothetical protein
MTGGTRGIGIGIATEIVSRSGRKSGSVAAVILTVNDSELGIGIASGRVKGSERDAGRGPKKGTTGGSVDGMTTVITLDRNLPVPSPRLGKGTTTARMPP